jgi:hypothetical protein
LGRGVGGFSRIYAHTDPYGYGIGGIPLNPPWKVGLSENLDTLTKTVLVISPNIAEYDNRMEISIDAVK